MTNPDLLIKNIGVLATPVGNCPVGGNRQGDIKLIKDAFIAVKDGVITGVGSAENLVHITLGEKTVVIDAGGKLVTPGLVDPHTHLIFSGWRQKELSLKLKGMKYLEILKMGGGILSTVRNTRKASLEELVSNGMKSLDRMLEHGTTTCEAKSGYGLNLKDELKSLAAIRELNRCHPLDVVPTFMGAHAVPEEYRENKKEYIRLIVEEMIPRVARDKLAEFCDVFCEEGVFDIEESRYILESGKAHGLIPKLHADEITPMGGAKLAAEVGALSAEHLIYATDEGIRAMAEAGTIAVLLPGTSFYLGESFARARTIIEAGIPVALATDFNPGSSPTESLQLVMNIACLKYRMTPEEVLTAVTLNSAAAVNRASTIGTIEVGKQADIVIWDAPDLDFIFYHYGVNLVRTVIKKGRVVVQK
ncbi:imidazolonepropionase [Thermosediminibacter oceani]|uniref:Imidazolonepropionase n=1 Tax=Thermosediminibacter oceani (strain ATCC BAA-1034 / DSM 16646 / JW/IW-1228P) TaxID=555079 RepID=D9RXZ8_THEOJ|nr:imidazolonepropionase [Thermosediminibacter oceani]ADL08222.1 imidazolonepropionase [Thermosediminibacter oceani DSM 16646]